jgi:cytochrome P450
MAAPSLASAPTPRMPLSAIAGLRALRSDPIGLMERAAGMGDVVRVPMPRLRVFQVSHPDLAWDVLSTGNRDFVKSPTLRNAKLVLGEGLLTSEGELHRRQRRLIQPLFHHGRIAGYADAMVAEAVRVADRLAPGPLDVHAAMGRLTLAVVGRTIFATDVESADARDVAAALDEVLAQFGRQFSLFLPITRRLPLPATRRFDRAVAVFDRMIEGMIAQRRASDVHGDDLLSLLLGAQEDGAGMSDRQVRDEALTLFLAGHETTSNALTWTWWLLSRHPQAEARLHGELDTVLGGRPPGAADLPDLPYTEAVLAESMRLRPPAWAISRQAVRAHELGTTRLPARSVAVVSPWVLHHDPRWWPQADAFRPERWLREDPERPRHAYLPFGAGPRMCIGEGFARMEARLLIATLAQRWRFELEPSARVELQPVITLRPRHGMAMRAVPRRAP